MHRSPSLSDFSLLGEVAYSSSGAIIKARCRKTGATVILKERRHAELGSHVAVDYEASLLGKLQHPNVVKCLGSFYDMARRSYFIILEFADKGDLHEDIARRRKIAKPYTEDELWNIFLQIADGVSYLHSVGIIHRDLKPLNVFLFSDGTVKLGDFGIGRELTHTSPYAQTHVGSPLYMSPEVCEGRPYDSATDMWSLGVILYEMACLAPPWRASGMADLVRQICGRSPVPVPTQHSRLVATAVSSLLQRTPEYRPDAVSFAHWLRSKLTAKEEEESKQQEQKHKRSPDEVAPTPTSAPTSTPARAPVEPDVAGVHAKPHASTLPAAPVVTPLPTTTITTRTHSESHGLAPATARPMTARDARLALRMAERQARVVEPIPVSVPAPDGRVSSVPEQPVLPVSKAGDPLPSRPWTARDHVSSARPRPMTVRSNDMIREPPPSPHELRRKRLEERRAQGPDGEFVSNMGIGRQLEQLRKLVLSENSNRHV